MIPSLELCFYHRTMSCSHHYLALPWPIYITTNLTKFYSYLLRGYNIFGCHVYIDNFLYCYREMFIVLVLLVEMIDK